MPIRMNLPPILLKSKVTHVATPPAPCEGMGRPFPLDPKPGARLRARRLA